MIQTKPTSPDIDDRDEALEEILSDPSLEDLTDVQYIKLRAKLTSWKNEQVREETEWWQYQFNTLYDQFFDNKYNSMKVTLEVINDRLAELATPNQTNERKV